MGRMSVATIDSPEFLNITSISPLISKCEIKVMYVGENRNHSLITKEVATKMAETLPGVPIVGYWCDTKEDFLDHGERVIIDGEGVKFKDMTKPYGFIAPNAKIWFQKFDDTDEFGNVETREYLMTEGYLWTEQYEECKRILTEENPQSMKLFEKNLQGYWSTEKNTGIDFFIINDAMFENLCILGKEVEPCFEGADITAPKVSSKFSKDDNFVISLFTMMKELKEELGNKGGTLMEEVIITAEEVVEEVTPVEEVVETITEEAPIVESTIIEDNSVEEAPAEIQDSIDGDFAKKDDKEKEDSEEESADSEESDTPDSEEEDKKKKVAENACGGGDDKKKKYELLETEFAALQAEYDALKAEYDSLVEFKNQIEDAKKDELINSFYMLSDEDKLDVVTNKSVYSLDEIEAKLSVICVRKKVNFNLDEEVEQKETVTTFNLDSVEPVSIPAYVSALMNVKNNK